jgi:hypothetical protein
VRPGQSPDGALLLPLEKARAGEEVPAFAVEVVYLSRGAAWNDKGEMKVPLPALDLPVSRTGLVLFHPPLFKLNPAPGAFRAQAYEEPSSTALTNGRPVGDSASNVVTLVSPGVAEDHQSKISTDSLTLPNAPEAQPANQAALDKFREKSKGGKVTGILPIRVSFPAVGPSLFLVSELTAENQVPNADLNYQREKKAGGK